MKAKALYHVGIYLRLSREEAPSQMGSRESGSISSQRELARDFVLSRKDMEIFDIYADDGYSGVSFKRPEFERLMGDVYGGRVDCIVVKDLSRFGRDYIEAGRLIQKTFPALNVRFIAITDHYDSLTAREGETDFVVPVKNFVNDAYCRDISCKVRSSQKAKRNQGEFIGAFAVYGYQKQGKNRISPDPYAAQIVRNIFAWKMEGMSCFAIAGKLNAMGVLSPMEYKLSKGENYATGFMANPGGRWYAMSVRRILTDEVYTGTLVQGKTEKINYKLDIRRKKPRDEWARVEGAHTPIVTAEEFSCVQKLMATGSRACKGEEKAHLFSGFLFCGDCGKPMARRVNRYQGKDTVTFICTTRNKGRGCSRHSIREKEAAGLVLAVFRSKFPAEEGQRGVAGIRQGREKPGDKENREACGEFSLLRCEVQRLRREEENYTVLGSGLYEDLKGGLITQKEYQAFHRLYEKQRQELQEAGKKQESTLGILEESQGAENLPKGSLEEWMGPEKLGRRGLLFFILRIWVYEDKRIKIELKWGEGDGVG